MIEAQRLVGQLARPMRLLDRRVRWIERYLQIPLSEQDATLVREACALSHVRLGEFYHWYLQKKLVSDTIRNLTRERGMAVVNSVDHSDYSSCSSLFESDRGVLLALPHHAHYIFSVVALAEKLRSQRPVLLFFGEPGRNPGNEIFDHMCRVFYGPGRNVDTAHDNRQGLAKAIRLLKNGAAVVIMPDAYTNEEHTLAIPFAGRSMSIMLGTAILARRTGALIQPMVSTPHGSGFGFKTVFGELIEHQPVDALSNESARIRDYRVMRDIFSFYERIMSPQLVYWQNVRKHLSQEGTFRELPPVELEHVARLLEHDPDLIGTTHMVDLRNASAA